MIYNPLQTDLSLKIDAGSHSLVDSYLKTKGDDSDASIKVNLKGILLVNGNLKEHKEAGNAEILVEFVKIAHKIKGEVTYNGNSPHEDVDLTLYTDFEKDNTKKIKFTSQSMVQPKSIDSKYVTFLLLLLFSGLCKKKRENINICVSGTFLIFTDKYSTLT